MLDGSGATPLIQDFILSTAVAHKAGDLMVLETDGDLTQAATNATEVFGVMQETVAAADITAGTTKAKVAIITRNQVWRCSADASTMSAVVGYTKTQNLVDCNTLDADVATSGSMALVAKDQLDDDGNVLAYVTFADTTFGNT
jgi:environmental stress-induced protein Ves